MTVADEVFQLMEERGGTEYFGEPVSQLEHALQAAWMATQAGCTSDLVVAALLHDVGHLLCGMGESAADEGIDTRHEVAGYDWLLQRFGHPVADPVLLHVPAKRWLALREPEYLAQLSPASVQSLALQGGPFTEAEARKFEEQPYYGEALTLRRFDDAAKVPGQAVPGLEEYRELLLAFQMLYVCHVTNCVCGFDLYWGSGGSNPGADKKP